MKVGILTFIDTINFGASLQAYALQEVIKELGHEPEILQYQNENVIKSEFLISKKSIKTIVKRFLIGKYLVEKKEKFRSFESKNLKQGLVLSSNCFDQVNEYYEAFVAGSDQIWNFSITKSDWIYFLSFVDNCQKKITYAPSFGNKVFPSGEMKKCAGYLTKIRHLSVREQSGAKMIDDICGLKATVVLDPTLLIDKDNWIRRCSFVPSIKHYILVYFPNNKKNVFSFVKRLRKRTKLPVVYLSISPKRQFRTKTIYAASPDEFVGWVRCADYVVTGSFHGTAFAINLNRQFFYEPSGKGSRIDNLVSKCHLEHRSISNINEIENDINWENVNAILQKEREFSTEWLSNALKEVEVDE